MMVQRKIAGSSISIHVLGYIEIIRFFNCLFTELITGCLDEHVEKVWNFEFMAASM